MQGGIPRQPACARRSGKALGGHAPCRAGRDRRRLEARPRAGRRDESLLAPRAFAVGYRAWRRDARQSQKTGPRPAAALRLAGAEAMLIANARMYSVTAQATT